MRHDTVITFASSGYVDLLRLWAAQSTPNMPEPPVVVCLDPATEEVARTLPGVEPYGGDRLDFDPADRQMFWINRLRTVMELGQGSAITVHSDLDAFWIKPTIPLLEQEPFDFAFSIDFALPNEIKEKWGFILCCGFFAYRPGPAANAFLQRWLQEARRYYDDQISVNRLLYSLNVEWRDHMFQGHACKQAEVSVDGRRVRFVALPWPMFVRRHPMAETADAVVAHPFWERRFHPSFIQSYAFVRETLGTLPPLELPSFPGHPGWRDYDWSWFHILQWIAGRATLSPEQRHHLGVLSTRFGEPARGVELLSALASTHGHDGYFRMDLARALHDAEDRRAAARQLKQAVADTRDLTLLKKLGALARAWRDRGLYLRVIARVAAVTVRSGRLRQVIARKLRNGMVALRRAAR